MAEVGIGVIGLGRMGTVYAYHAARQIEQARLVAVADPRREKTDDFTSRISGVTAYADHADLLANPDIQGVIIATPTSTHHDLVIEAAAAGKAIFCEKPTALTLRETDEMLDAINKHKVAFQVGFMRRFDRAYMEASRRIEAGEIGQPVMIRCIGRDPRPTTLEYASPAVSGGIIVDMGIHDIDVVRWLMNDDIERIHTEAASLVYPELLTVGDVDNVMLNLRLNGGQLGNIEVSRTAVYGYDIQCEIVGSEGTMQVGYLRETAITLLNRQGVWHDVVPHFPERFGAAYTAQIEHFVDCVVKDIQPRVTPEDARAALQASIAATRSQHTGEVVYVKDVTD